ncbi:tetratricopeptide repeat protein [Legionella sp. km772]|uniref:tetratricopeptide repeat protein n=1 Tax=Legionella sp. km772 TaxID=2498111 RepID=UPI000F8E453F|nr:tetratricopeptide repeat protein [Legionella sp. km772]RUR07211.1 tetratricopeptide repeat protein [Legionella sp. km772]
MNKKLSDLFNQARQLLSEAKYDEAIALFEQILALDPQHQESLHFLGLTYAQMGKIHQALSFLQQANAINPEPYLLNNLANAYKKNNQIEEAIRHYLQAIELAPNYAQAHSNLANLYALQNNYEDALAHYIKATHAAPDFSSAHFNLGLLLLKNNELDAAKRQFSNVLALNPDAIEAQFYLGVLHLEANELDQAEQAFQAVLAQQNEHVEALVNLGVIALKRGQNQIAVDYFTKALALDNDEMDARNNLASTFMHYDRFENALMHYDVLLQKEPNNIEYLYNSGVAQMALGHLNEATMHFDHILQLEPTHASSLNNLAAIYLKLDNRETSRHYLERALEVNPEDKISRHMLNAITGIKNGENTPEYAHNLFNNYALYYDQHMQGQLNYSIPTHIARSLHQFELLELDNALDLGCGTGLTGVAVREYCKHLTGVDIAEKMIEHAKKKAIYDELLQMELLDFLKQDPKHYDLIVAADVLPYFGDLAPLIQLVSEHLTEEHYFIFTTEINEESPWQLESSARFSHQPAYLNTLTKEHSLTIVKQEKIPARIQNQLPLEVMLYVTKKASS